LNIARVHRRHGQEGEKAIQILRRRDDEIAIPAHDLGRALQRPEGRAGDDLVDRVQPEQERGDHAEIAAAATQPPVQIRVLPGTGRDQAAVGQHHVGFEQVVHRQAALARQMADAAAEREAADACRADDAAGRGHAEGMRRMVNIAPGATAFDAHGARRGIDADALHRRQVDHQPLVAHPQSAGVVAAAADRQAQQLLAREVDAAHHVGNVAAVDDEPRVAVDHRVVDTSRRVVVRVVRLHDAPAQRGGEFSDGLGVEHGDSPVGGTSGGTGFHVAVVRAGLGTANSQL
jgi:hypothetical protein